MQIEQAICFCEACGAGLAKGLAAGKNTCGTIILIKLWCHRYFFMEWVFMSSLCISVMQKNKIIFLILLLLFSLLSVYMPHGLLETHEHQDYESLFKHVINNNKSATNLGKLLKILKVFFLKIFKLPQMISNLATLANIRLALFNMHFSKVFILHLFSVLCSYFHGGKFKHRMLHSDLLPLMAV